MTIPDRVPLESQDYASKYDLASKLSQLKGVAGLKAQLYGLESVIQKRAAPKGAKAAPTSAAKADQGPNAGLSLEDMLK